LPNQVCVTKTVTKTAPKEVCVTKPVTKALPKELSSQKPVTKTVPKEVCATKPVTKTVPKNVISQKHVATKLQIKNLLNKENSTDTKPNELGKTVAGTLMIPKVSKRSKEQRVLTNKKAKIENVLEKPNGSLFTKDGIEKIEDSLEEHLATLEGEQSLEDSDSSLKLYDSIDSCTQDYNIESKDISYQDENDSGLSSLTFSPNVSDVDERNSGPESNDQFIGDWVDWMSRNEKVSQNSDNEDLKRMHGCSKEACDVFNRSGEDRGKGETCSTVSRRKATDIKPRKRL